MRMISIAVSIAVASSAAVATSASPAAAADKSIEVYPMGGVAEQQWAGRGHFYDDEDLLCAYLGIDPGNRKIAVRIRPTGEEGPTLRVVDHTAEMGSGGVCQDATAIPEGAEYRMRVKVVQWDGDIFIASSSFNT